jgi:hypothetical protein
MNPSKLPATSLRWDGLDMHDALQTGAVVRFDDSADIPAAAATVFSPADLEFYRAFALLAQAHMFDLVDLDTSPSWEERFQLPLDLQVCASVRMCRLVSSRLVSSRLISSHLVSSPWLTP